MSTGVTTTYLPETPGGVEHPPTSGKTVPSQRDVDQMSTEELLLAYKRTGDQSLKWPLILRYEGMIKNIALQIRGVYSGFAQVEDIVSEGVLALMSSIDKYDPDKGVKFETYVSKRIRGMVIDLARRQDWLPRNVRKRAKDIDQASGDLYHELGRFPTDPEVAARLGITPAKYQKDLSSMALCNVLSLDALLEDSETGGYRMEVPSEDMTGQPDAMLQERELQSVLAEGIRTLRKNEQIVLSLYYEKNFNMKEIAQVMGVSEPRISQLHARAIQKLKLFMSNYMGVELTASKSKERRMG